MSSGNDPINFCATGSDTHSKKRKVTEDSGMDKAAKVKTNSGSAATSSSEHFPKKDETFYFEDGNIVLLASLPRE
jgi:hypothetical protein